METSTRSKTRVFEFSSFSTDLQKTADVRLTVVLATPTAFIVLIEFAIVARSAYSYIGFGRVEYDYGEWP